MTSPRCRSTPPRPTADLVRADGKNLVARDATPGTYTTTLDDGRSGPDHDRRRPAPLPLTQWTLDVDDWLPGATATETAHARTRSSSTA